MREQFANRSAAQLLAYEEAGRRKLQVPWNSTHIAAPEFTGCKVLRDFSIAELVPYIDWSPFFHTWEMRGRYPDLLDDPVRGPAARDLLANARELLDEIVKKKLFTAHAVYGLYPANSEGDDIVLYGDVSRAKEFDAFSHVTPTERELEG